jgi:hypothetical protein
MLEQLAVDPTEVSSSMARIAQPQSSRVAPDDADTRNLDAPHIRLDDKVE